MVGLNNPFTCGLDEDTSTGTASLNDTRIAKLSTIIRMFPVDHYIYPRRNCRLQKLKKRAAYPEQSYEEILW